jgi:hypothetical protein
MSSASKLSYLRVFSRIGRPVELDDDRRDRLWIGCGKVGRELRRFAKTDDRQNYRNAGPHDPLE